MNISFSKYHGTGNDFILIDNRSGEIALTRDQIALLCHRRFGIGADGLMLLDQEPGFDFRMVYYNSDGGESTMCGNGGRCITAFAKKLGLVSDHANFKAIDGAHTAFIDEAGIVSLHMVDVDEIKHYEGYSVLNTGSPHFILPVADVQAVDVFHEGRTIRNRAEFLPSGINVNFVQPLQNGVSVRTYERGVEDETLSCGTGVTAAAIAFVKEESGDFVVPIQTPGGPLEVSFTRAIDKIAENVILKGPAVFVFEGVVEV